MNYEISFDPLWKTLFERKLSKGDLAKETGLSSSTIAKLGKGESVTVDVIARICFALKCTITEVVEIRILSES